MIDYFITVTGLCVGSFLYQFFGDELYKVAMERSYFMWFAVTYYYLFTKYITGNRR